MTPAEKHAKNIAVLQSHPLVQRSRYDWFRYAPLSSRIPQASSRARGLACVLLHVAFSRSICAHLPRVARIDSASTKVQKELRRGLNDPNRDGAQTAFKQYERRTTRPRTNVVLQSALGRSERDED